MKIEKYLNGCDVAAVFSYCAFIYFLPISTAICESFAGFTLFFFFLKRIGLFSFNLKIFLKRKVSSSHLWLLQLFMTFLKSFKPQTSFLSWPIGMYILICALSIGGSDYKDLSLSAFFFKVLEWAFLFFVFIECMTTKKRLKIFMTVFFVSMTVICFDGLYQAGIGKDFIFGHPAGGGRVAASFRHPNDFGAYLIFIIPILLNILLTYRPQNKFSAFKLKNGFMLYRAVDLLIISFVLFAAALICLGLTYSRGAWFGFFVSLIFIAWQKRKNFLKFSILIFLFLFLFHPKLLNLRSVSLISDAPPGTMESSVDTSNEGLPHSLSDSAILQQASSLTDNQTFLRTQGSSLSFQEKIKIGTEKALKFFHYIRGSGRIGYWEEAIAIIRTRPFLGSGLNTYSHVAPRYKVTWGGYPHNCYLQMGAEIGLLGLGVFLWILGSLFVHTLRHWKTMQDLYFKSILFGALTGFLGFLFHSLLDTNFYSVQLANLMWVGMGLIVAIQNVMGYEKESIKI